MDDESLLKEFVRAWNKFKEVISWLRKTVPLFFRHRRSAHGKGQGRTLHELFSMFILDKNEMALRQATFHLIQREKDDEIIDQALMRYVSVAFLEIQEMNFPLYEKKWLEPILRYSSRVYFEDTGAWFVHDGLQKLDSAITQACERIVNLCPTDDIAKHGKRILVGLANVQTYMKLQEIKAGKNPEVSSIINRMDHQELENMYRTCHALNNLPLVGLAISQYHNEQEKVKLETLVLKVCGSFGVVIVQLLNRKIVEAWHRLDLQDPNRYTSTRTEDPTRIPSRYAHSYITSYMMENLGHSMETQAEKMLADEDSHVRSIFRRNCDAEIQRMYKTCFLLDALPGLEKTLLRYEIRDMETKVWDLLKSTTGQWFQGDSLTMVNSQITNICDLIARRCFVQTGLCERQQLNLIESVQYFISLEELPSMFNDKNSFISSVFMRMDLDEIDRIYRQCLKLTNLPTIEIEILRFEIHICTTRMVALFEKGEGKWFSEELYLDKFDKDLEEGYKRMTSRVYGHTTDARRIVIQSWLVPLRDVIFGEVQRLHFATNSEISVILRSNNVEELRHMYEICHDTLHLNPLGPDIFRFQMRMDHAKIREYIRETEGKLFVDAGPSRLSRIDYAISQSYSRLTHYWEVYGGFALSDEKEALIRLLIEEVERILEDEDSEVSCILKSNDEEQINRMYQSCFATANLQRIGLSIFAFELEKHYEDIEALIENSSERWFQDSSFNKILSVVSETLSLISRRCVSGSARRLEEQQRFQRGLENAIISNMSSAMGPMVLACIRKGLGEVESLFKNGSILRSLPGVGTSVIALMLLAEGEQILSEFYRERAPDHQHTEAENEAQFSFIEPLKPALGVSVSLGEVEEFFRSLFNLRSKYMRMKETYFETFEIQNDPVEAAVYRVINRPFQSSHGQSTITEILAGFVDLLMTNIGEGNKQSQLELAVEMLSMSSTKLRFRLLSQQYMARRLLRMEENEILERMELERNMMNTLSSSFGEQLVVQMRDLIANLEFVLLEQEERTVSGPPSRSEIAPSASIYESVTIPSISAKVLKKESWPVHAETRITGRPPLAEAFSRLEHRFEIEEPPKIIEYVHSLGKITLETSLFAGNEKKIDIVGSVPQAAIILLFNSHESVTYGGLLEALQKNESNEEQVYLSKTKALLSAALQSLLSDKCRLLLKTPNTEKLRSSDVFRINHSFTAPVRRLQLPTVQSSSVEEERAFSNLVLNLFKKESVQAAIMKVMKQVREMRLDKLFEEVLKLLDNGVVEFDFNYLKSQVGTLVQRDDLKDHGGSNPTITYVA